jgi:hypothetical protein
MYRNQIRVPVFTDAKLREFISVSTWTYVLETFRENQVDLSTANSDFRRQVLRDVNDIIYSIYSIYSSVTNAKADHLKKHPKIQPDKLAGFVWWFLPRCGQIMLDKFIDGYGLRRVQVELTEEEKAQHAQWGLGRRSPPPVANPPAA